MYLKTRVHSPQVVMFGTYYRYVPIIFIFPYLPPKSIKMFLFYEMIIIIICFYHNTWLYLIVLNNKLCTKDAIPTNIINNNEIKTKLNFWRRTSRH